MNQYLHVKERKIDLIDKKLDILDDILILKLSVDDLRRIMKVFGFVEYRMELEGEMYLDWYDKDLMNRLNKTYRVLLQEGEIECL